MIAWRGWAPAALFLLAWGWTMPSVAGAQVKVLPLDRAARSGRVQKAPAPIGSSSYRKAMPLLEQRWQSELRVRQQLGPHGISRKGLRLRERRVANLAKGIAAAEPETLKVLLVRIAFDTDRSGSLTSITEDGNFLLTPDSTVIFDRPPHDKAYFEAHLAGLEEYWKSMAAGRLEIESEVLPRGDQDAYRLSDIADYGPGRGGSWTIDALERLVQDMIVAADEGTQSDGSVSLADFDDDDDNTYVIFAHAGGDLQSNLVFNENDPDYSPNDIPTFFVTLGDSASVALTSTDTESGELGRMTEVSVIPESTSQDGLLGSIAAALYHEFGHALGLPDLYSTATGLPTVGFWDIMDTGTNLTAAVRVELSEGVEDTFAVTGLLPPQTSAWCKWYLGFAEENRAGGRRQNYPVRAWRAQNAADKVLRLDVSPNEFFLVTSRWVPFVANVNWNLKSDPATGVIQYMGNYRDENNPVNAHMYDFYLPWGGGLMVWRVRQDRIDESIAFNQVQTLPRKLGVELVEADGIKDLGIFDFTTIGLVGSNTDAFRAFTASPDTGVSDYPETAVRFGPDTLPASTSSIGIETGARLENIPESRDGTSFVDAWVEGLLDFGVGAGFPLELDPVSEAPMRGDAHSLTPWNFAAGPALVLAARSADASGGPGLYAYAFDGSPRFAGACVFDFATDLAGPPAAALDFGGSPALLVAERGGTLHAFDDLGPLGPGNQLSERAGFPVALPDSVDQAAIEFEGTVLVTNLSKSLIDVVALDGSRQAAWSQAMTAGLQLRSAPVRAEIQVGGSRLVVIAFASDRGLEFRNREGTAALGTSPGHVAWNDGAGGRRGHLVAMAAADSAASDDVVFVDDAGRVSLFRDDGTGSWTAQRFGEALDEAPIAAPAAADVNGDGDLDWVAVTPDRLYVRGPSGASLYGFPVEVTDRYLLREEREDRFVGAPVIADVDLDGTNEILLESSFGLLHGVDSDGGFLEGFPQQRSGGGAVAPLLWDTGGPDSRRAVFLFEALGDTLRPGRRTRNARLNAVDLGPTPSAENRPAFEWTTLGGSPARSGRGERGVPRGDGHAAAARLDAEPIVYPNPLRADAGSVARVRFYSAAPHTARLSVYSLEGELLTTVPREVAGQQTEEIGWDTAGLASGPYLCRLDYVGVDGSQTRILTLYVER